MRDDETGGLRVGMLLRAQEVAPYLDRLHEQWTEGQDPQLTMSPDEYARRRKSFHATGKR